MYDRPKPFVPTVDHPGPVSFSENGSTWTVTRDVFLRFEDGAEWQLLVTQSAPAGSVLEPAVQYVDRPAPLSFVLS